jgi:hydroxymethylpyrimidine pyrophosphatase-like HAD family hydrolase
VAAQGVGVGWFGGSTAAIAAGLAGSIPAFFGVRDGLSFRQWLPEASALDESDPRQREALAGGVARYAHERASRLGVPDDRAREMSGHDATWEQASRWLGVGFGRLALPLRPLLHASARRLLRTARASLVDGEMGPGKWFEVEGSLVKSDFAEGPFAYQVPFVYDAAYDVAAAASRRLPDADFGAKSRAAYESASGNPIDEVRWFLYQLLSELDRLEWARRVPPEDGHGRAALVELLTDGERRAAYLHRSFLAAYHLADVDVPATGELCAIDVDGVLESGRWSYPAPSTASLLALRSLTRHGFRPVIATGRSLDEAVARCRDYRLAGAVAEYGAAIFDAASDRSHILLGPDELDDLRLLRVEVGRLDGVELDEAYRYSVRAFMIRQGARRALPDELAQRAVATAGLAGKIRIVRGWSQTDFAPIDIDKRTGLQALARLLGVDREPSLALAVGDARPDLAMFRLARIAAVPANAEAGLETDTGAIRSRRSWGAGLADAVSMVVGHRPGGCAECSPRQAKDPAIGMLLALLDAADAEGARKLWPALRAGRKLRRL